MKLFIDSIPVSEESQCSYFLDKVSRVKAFLFREKMPLQILEYLLNQGFRRSGDIYYQNHCPHCNMCLSYRLRPESFTPSKSQKRIININKDVKIIFTSPGLDQEKEKLYLDYQFIQHYLKQFPPEETPEFNKEKTLSIMYEQMYKNIHNSIEMDVFLNEKLLGFAIFDLSTQSISAVYSVYDPKAKRRSLGTFIILKSIEWAKDNDYRYYHLGFYIPGHPKMEYKSFFKPAEIRSLLTGEWTDAEEFLSLYQPSIATKSEKFSNIFNPKV